MAKFLTASTHQCGYHLGTSTVCRLVQLSAERGSGEWQEPLWICTPCRTRMHGQYRYVSPGVLEGSKETLRQSRLDQT